MNSAHGRARTLTSRSRGSRRWPASTYRVWPWDTSCGHQERYRPRKCRRDRLGRRSRFSFATARNSASVWSPLGSEQAGRDRVHRDPRPQRLRQHHGRSRQRDLARRVGEEIGVQVRHFLIEDVDDRAIGHVVLPRQCRCQQYRGRMTDRVQPPQQTRASSIGGRVIGERRRAIDEPVDRRAGRGTRASEQVVDRGGNPPDRPGRSLPRRCRPSSDRQRRPTNRNGSRPGAHRQTNRRTMIAPSRFRASGNQDGSLLRRSHHPARISGQHFPCGSARRRERHPSCGWSPSKTPCPDPGARSCKHGSPR